MALSDLNLKDSIMMDEPEYHTEDNHNPLSSTALIDKIRTLI